MTSIALFATVPVSAEAESNRDFTQEMYFLELSGVMTVNDVKVDDYTVFFFEDGKLVDSFYIDERREQYFGMEFGHNYALKFVKKGYKNRVLLVDTFLPQDAHSDDYTFRYSIEFIPKDAPSNTFDDFPVAFVTYDAKQKDFDYNKTYHNNVRFNAGQPAGQTASQNARTADVE
jgi:hypothetical protein